MDPDHDCSSTGQDYSHSNHSTTGNTSYIYIMYDVLPDSTTGNTSVHCSWQGWYKTSENKVPAVCGFGCHCSEKQRSSLVSSSSLNVVDWWHCFCSFDDLRRLRHEASRRSAAVEHPRLFVHDWNAVDNEQEQETLLSAPNRTKHKSKLVGSCWD